MKFLISGLIALFLFVSCNKEKDKNDSTDTRSAFDINYDEPSLKEKRSLSSYEAIEIINKYNVPLETYSTGYTVESVYEAEVSLGEVTQNEFLPKKANDSSAGTMINNRIWVRDNSNEETCFVRFNNTSIIIGQEGDKVQIYNEVKSQNLDDKEVCNVFDNSDEPDRFIEIVWMGQVANLLADIDKYPAEFVSFAIGSIDGHEVLQITANLKNMARSDVNNVTMFLDLSQPLNYNILYSRISFKEFGGKGMYVNSYFAGFSDTSLIEREGITTTDYTKE